MGDESPFGHKDQRGTRLVVRRQLPDVVCAGPCRRWICSMPIPMACDMFSARTAVPLVLPAAVVSVRTSSPAFSIALKDDAPWAQLRSAQPSPFMVMSTIDQPFFSTLLVPVAPVKTDSPMPALAAWPPTVHRVVPVQGSVPHEVVGPEGLVVVEAGAVCAEASEGMVARPSARADMAMRPERRFFMSSLLSFGISN